MKIRRSSSLSRLLFLISAAVAPLVASPSSARAQIGFEDLLGSITDIDLSFTCWSTRSAALRRSDCPGGSNGYGVEVLWAVATIPLGRDSVTETWVRREKRVTRVGSRVDSTIVYEPKEEHASASGYAVEIELGLGYSQFSGFRSSDDRLELRGTVREVPSVTLYGSLEGPGVLKHLNPYVGIRSGLVQLHGVQVFEPSGDSVHVYAATGEVFQFGGAFGIAGSFGPIDPFIEADLNLRRFSSIDWTAGEGGTIPSALPRELDFSGPSVSVGVQIHIRD